MSDKLQKPSDEATPGQSLAASALLAAIHGKRQMWLLGMPDAQCYPTLAERVKARIEELDWMEQWIVEKLAANNTGSPTGRKTT